MDIWPVISTSWWLISWRYAKHKGQDSTKELSEDEKTRLKEIMDD